MVIACWKTILGLQFFSVPCVLWLRPLLWNLPCLSNCQPLLPCLPVLPSLMSSLKQLLAITRKLLKYMRYFEQWRRVKLFVRFEGLAPAGARRPKSSTCCRCAVASRAASARSCFIIRFRPSSLLRNCKYQSVSKWRI